MTTLADRPPPPIPARPTQANMRSAVQDCRACDLWEESTQAVMGEGAGEAMEEFVSDLAVVAQWLGARATSSG